MGERVRELREARGLTQGEVAKAVRDAGGDLSQTQISTIEGGTVRRPRCLPELAEVLRTSQAYLLGKTDDPSPSSPTLLQPSRTFSISGAERIDTKSESVLISLFRVGVSGGAVQLQAAGDRITGPDELRNIVRAFAIKLWDDDNAPWLRLGATLYIDPSDVARIGDWALFCSQEGDTITSPCVGILLAITATGWRVQRGSYRMTLTKAEHPLALRVVSIKP